jgi:uncharacterized protein involved in exopolysaccharide biosynthesis
MKLEPVRNTTLVKISFSSEDPKEAAGIANAIATAYQDYRLARQRQMANYGIRAVEEQYQKQEQDIKAKQENLQQLGKQLYLPTPESPDELLKSNFPSYFQAKRDLQKLIDLQNEIRNKIEKENFDMVLPIIPAVEITDTAKPPQFPASPNRPLGAGLLVIGLLATVGGVFLFKSSNRKSA